MKHTLFWGVFLFGILLLSGCSNSKDKGEAENTAVLCSDGLDNDGDGVIDCADGECLALPVCIPDAGTDGGDTATEEQVQYPDTWASHGVSVDPGTYVVAEAGPGRFGLVTAGKAVPLVVSSADHEGVLRVLDHFQADIERVTNIKPTIIKDTIPPGTPEVVILGTIGGSPLIDGLIASGKLDVSDVQGKWETFVTQTVSAPMDGVTQALVIAGSDKRATMYGMFDISSQMGVSPWHFWADVPPKKHSEVYVLEGRHSQGEPAVKYRGIFINHEGPCLSGWADANYGGFVNEFYELVFELILRMKGNYLWPAMWGRAFYDDDPQNAVLANIYGIVIGTSHHEPMMRAHEEWNRYGSGEWNYETNSEVLQDFWRTSVQQRLHLAEETVTIGMRGDGDYDLATNMDLMQTIITDQRTILQEVTGQDPSQTEQIWTLYKDVQEYYDRGLTPPSDVTIVFSDDNWGNVRRLPAFQDRSRIGGHGIYYHFEYLGSPRGYRWLNSSPLPRVWEQMEQAYRFGADRLWVVNIGDIKPLELPIHFFLDFAWDPERWPLERLDEYTHIWAEQQFGPEHAAEITSILGEYTKYNARRKIELLSTRTYSLENFHEADTIVSDYNQLAAQAQALSDKIPAELKDAYYELVLHPVKASAIVNEMLVAAGKNELYAEQGRNGTNALAERVRVLFEEDKAMTDYFNLTLLNGKWDPIMSQVHLGYKSWEAPDKNVMPEVIDIELPADASMGVAIQGSKSWWPLETEPAVLPEITPYFASTQYIDVFNRGQTAFDFTATIDATYVTVTPAAGSVTDQQRLTLSVDWTQAPAGVSQVPITVTGAGASVVVQAVINNPAAPVLGQFDGFVETNGYVSIEAEQFTTAVNADPIEWKIIPDMGRTLSAVKPYPLTGDVFAPGGDTPRLEYKMYLNTTGELEVTIYASPTLNIKGPGLRYGLSFDDQEPIIIDIHGTYGNNTWETWVKDNLIHKTTKLSVSTPGEHTLKFWMVDTGIAIEKIVVDTGSMPQSYLGPPSTRISMK